MKSGVKGDEMERLRDAWRTARNGKLSRKAILMAEGKDAISVRHDRVYRECVKCQRRAATRMRHIERSMNRKRENGKKG